MKNVLAALLGRELKDGEKVAWSDSPGPKVFFLRHLNMMLFAIPWTVFALFWFLVSSGAVFPIPWENRIGPLVYIFPLFGIPFVLFGLWFFLIPFWEYRRASRTLYAITDRRVVILDTRDGKKAWHVHSVYPGEITQISRRAHRNGLSSIFFAESRKMSRRGGHYYEKTGFIGITDVEKVEGLLHDLCDMK